MLAVVTLDGRIRLVDAATGTARWAVQSYESDVLCRVAMSPDGRFVASVGESEETWQLLDTGSGVVCMTGTRHDGTGGCVCKATRSGRRTSLDDGCPAQAHSAGLYAVAFSPCGQRLATGGEDRAVILWDARTGKAELVLQGHASMVRSVSFSADGARLASGGWDGTIRVWDAATGALLRAIPNGSLVMGVQFSPTDGRTLASAGYSAKQWDVDSGEMIRSIEGRDFAVFSPDGRTIATASVQLARDVLLVDAETGAIRLRMDGQHQQLFSASFSVDGSKLASGFIDGACKVWDSSTGALLRTIELGGSVWSVSWGRDWVQDTQRGVAFAMGHHPRLGAGSRVLGLDEELLRMILDRV